MLAREGEREREREREREKSSRTLDIPEEKLVVTSYNLSSELVNYNYPGPPSNVQVMLEPGLNPTS